MTRAPNPISRLIILVILLDIIGAFGAFFSFSAANGASRNGTEIASVAAQEVKAARLVLTQANTQRALIQNFLDEIKFNCEALVIIAAHDHITLPIAPPCVP